MYWLIYPLPPPTPVRSLGCVAVVPIAGIMSTSLFAIIIPPLERWDSGASPPERVS